MARNFKINNQGMYDIRRSPKVKADLERRAAAIAKKANDDSGLSGYKTSSTQGKKKPQGRWRATVITSDSASAVDNAKHNRLLKSLDAGRAD